MLSMHINQVTVSFAILIPSYYKAASNGGLTDPLLSVDIRYHQQSKTIDDSPSCCCLCFVTELQNVMYVFLQKCDKFRHLNKRKYAHKIASRVRHD